MPPKRLVRRELLDRTARPLLVRLLAPYADFFASRGLSLADLEATPQDDRRLVRRVHDLLHEDTAAVPGELALRLVALEALGNASGQASLFELCPALTALRLGAEDTAATVILDHPDVLARARRVADPGAGPLFSDFDAVSARAPECTPAAIGALVAAFQVWLTKHGRTPLCTPHVADRPHELHLEIEHGRPPATDDIVGEALELTQMTAVRAERAIVIFDRAKARLSVHAAHAAIKDLVRKLVGEHLFGDAAHFRKSGIYALTPLSRGLDAALAWEDVPGLKGVKLLGILVVGGGERVKREVVGNGDLRKTLLAHQLKEMLDRGGVVEWMKVRLELEGHARPVVVELSPSKKKFPQASGDVEPILDEWLLARGYMVLEERRAVLESYAPGAAAPGQAEAGATESAETA